MLVHIVSAHPSSGHLPRQEQLAWKLAILAADRLATDEDVSGMIINRIIDNAAVATASLNRRPVQSARAQALAHPRSKNAASLFGSAAGVDAEWAAWANGVAVRELDYHDTFLAADYSHPADNIPPLLAVAQQCKRSGAELIQAIATAYEVQVSLVRGICLHAHKIDHIGHLAPSVAAGIGTLLGLETEIIYQAIQQSLHCAITTRQSRKGEISSWKAFAPAHAGKIAIEAVDRAMRGENSPSPAYEGEDGLLAWILDGRTNRDRGQDPFAASYEVPLIEPGEPKRAIMETYTKAHSAEYQSQALIDLAFGLRRRIADLEAIREVIIHTSHHTHNVIGTGAGDPQKMNPKASRETLDHSIMYIFAVAMQDGEWHHERSYAKERAGREDTIRLWHKIRTCEDKEWTRRYHASDPGQKAFGARVEIIMQDGSKLSDELAIADAHPYGRKPFARRDYIDKFSALGSAILAPEESARFLALVQSLPELKPEQLALNPVAPPGYVLENNQKGIF